MNRTYTDQQKAQVIAEWQTGATQNEIAAKHQLPKSTVSTWTKNYPRTALVPERDLREEFGRLVYRTAVHTFEALDAHVRAAAAPELAGTVEGWTTRVAELTRTAAVLGGAIQAGSGEPIAISDGANST